MVGIAVLSFAYVLSQFYRSFLAVLTPILTSELAMSDTQLSYASGAWFATFALAQFPVGVWLDKYGPRKTSSLMHGIFGAGGALLFATATGPVQVMISMAFIGFGCSSILMAAYILIARNYSPAIFATMASTFIAIGMSGTVLGAEPLANAVTVWGWREVSFGLAAISLVISMIVFFTVKDPERIIHSRKGSVIDLLKIRQLWPLFPLIACSYAIPTSIRSLWAGPYLEQVHGLDILEIGRVVLYLALAQIIGTMVYGPLDRVFNTRKWIITTGNALLLLSCIWLAFNAGSSLTSVTIVLVIASLFGSATAVQLTHGKSYIPEHMTGRGFTLLNFFSMGGVAIMQLTSGIVVETFSIPSDAISGYSALFAFYAIYLAVTLGFYQFSRDVKPRQVA